MAPTPLFNYNPNRLPNTAIFLSGSGSNAEKLLQTLQKLDKPVLNVAALVTDAPETSRARELGKIFSIPVIEHDIREYYFSRGETRVSIATPRGQELREMWTTELKEKLAPLNLDFGVFAGFVPLTNLTQELPCLNVHPGDLTYLKDGQRLLVGLHTIPVERAIIEGLDYMRSSVILVEPYSGSGGEMDSGHILGLSPKVPIDFMGKDSSKSQIVCFICGALACFVLYWILLQDHYSALSRGVLDLRDVLVFLSVAVVAVIASIFTINKLTRK